MVFRKVGFMVVGLLAACAPSAEESLGGLGNDDVIEEGRGSTESETFEVVETEVVSDSCEGLRRKDIEVGRTVEMSVRPDDEFQLLITKVRRYLDWSGDEQVAGFQTNQRVYKDCDYQVTHSMHGSYDERGDMYLHYTAEYVFDTSQDACLTLNLEDGECMADVKYILEKQD